MKNPKYKENKKNGGVIPAVNDIRTMYIPIGCQNCIECRKQKAREWTIRLMEDIREHKNGVMVTLTLSNESYRELASEVINESYTEENRLSKIGRYHKSRKKADEMTEDQRAKAIERTRRRREGYGLDNAIITLAVRRFNERWRKKYKKAVRHWLVTELGHNGTENIHAHGIIYAKEKVEEIRRIWKYGYIYPRSEDEKRINYVSERTIKYSVKYITKIDKDHEYYKGIILCSPGIGAYYGKSLRYRENKYKEEGTKETYTTRTGHEVALPIYYRNNIYTDEEKEKLWLEKLERNKRYVLGSEIDISKSEREYWAALKYAQEKNKRLGYGDNTIDWERKEYEEERRKMMQEKRMN